MTQAKPVRQFFTAPWCGACKQRKATLDAKGYTDFELIDVETDPTGNHYGMRALPAFKLDGMPATWEQFLGSFK